MQHAQLKLISPALNAPAQSEAEVLGSVVWLSLHAKNKNKLPLHALTQWLIPALNSQQYILASVHDGQQWRPVAFMSWANLNAEIESRYVDNPDTGLQPQEWASGDRMWVIDWLAPFGHSRQFRRALMQGLSQTCFRFLYHRGGDRGLRVLTFKGTQVAAEQARQWWRDRPILAQTAFSGQ